MHEMFGQDASANDDEEDQGRLCLSTRSEERLLRVSARLGRTGRERVRSSDVVESEGPSTVCRAKEATSSRIRDNEQRRGSKEKGETHRRSPRTWRWPLSPGRQRQTRRFRLHATDRWARAGPRQRRPRRWSQRARPGPRSTSTRGAASGGGLRAVSKEGALREEMA